MFNNLWTEKYRPTTLDEMVLSANNRVYFKSIKDEIPNLLFVGSPGIGKNTIAKIIIKLQILFFNKKDFIFCVNVKLFIIIFYYC